MNRLGIETNYLVEEKFDFYEIKINIPNAPYQKNILKEISSSQTSPIGIIKQTEKQIKTTK